MSTFTVTATYPVHEDALIAIFKALELPYTMEKHGVDKYDPAFVAKMEQSRKEMQEGKFETIKTKDLWK